jgi:hypothetical protein
MVLSLPALTGTATASYELTVTKSLATQQVSVAGTFTVTGTGSFPTPVLSFAPAPAAVPAGLVTCVPANTAPASCTFSQSWSDTSIAAATGGTLTVSVGAATATAPYNFAGAFSTLRGNLDMHVGEGLGGVGWGGDGGEGRHAAPQTPHCT